jgi:hypothetical protein
MLLTVRNVAVRLPSSAARHLFAGIFDRNGLCCIAAGVGDQDVDRPKLALDMPAHVLDLAVLRQVRGNLTRAAAGPLDLRPHVQQCRGVPAMQRHLGAFLRKARGDGGADAA